jgi:hypothetical protein
MSKNANKWAFRNFVSEAFSLATHGNTNTIQSIAFPAIGCGQYGCNSNFVAKALIMAVVFQLQQQPSLKLDVYFVIQQYQQNVFDAFRNELMAFTNNGPIYTTSRSSSNLAHLPPQVPKQQKNKKGFVVEKRPVDQSSSEYTVIVSEFWSTMTSKLCTEIVRIDYVWNERWYKQYIIHKDEFSQRLQSNTEKRLFHGCSDSAADNIIKECFNRSYCGKNGKYALTNVCHYHKHFQNKKDLSIEIAYNIVTENL